MFAFLPKLRKLVHHPVSISCFLLLLGSGITLAFIYLPPLFEREMITRQIIIINCGRPIQALEQLDNGTIWAPYHSYVVTPSLETEMANVAGNLYAPDIVKDGDRYLMWYGAQSSKGHDAIHMAISTDGVDWTKLGVVISTGTNNHVNDPSVVIVNGTFYMYYSVAPVREMDEVWCATSPNGYNWTIHGAVVLPSENQTDWDSLKVGRPAVLYQDGLFKMWFDGSQRSVNDPMMAEPGSGRHVGYATSLDGIHWIKYENNPIVMHSGAIDVEYAYGKYLMVEESGTGIYWRTGDSETNFELSAKKLFNNTSTEFDPYGHVTPFIWVENGQWIATYTGAATRKSWDGNRIDVWYPMANISVTVNDGFIGRFCTNRDTLKWTISTQNPSLRMTIAAVYSESNQNYSILESLPVTNNLQAFEFCYNSGGNTARLNSL
jgi:predicted GH43/DUF377 family glycosyl hydrolase